MNNYYTLIYLNQELNRNLSGGEFKFAISPHKDVLECYIGDARTVCRLVFSANAQETTLFTDDYRPPKKRNVFEFFTLLEGQKINRTSLAYHDRLLSLHFEGELHLIFKLFGNRANAFLVENDIIIDAFKNPDEMQDKSAPKPQAPDFNQHITDKAKPKNQVTTLNPLLPRNLLPPLLRHHQVKNMTVPQVKTFTHNITEALQTDPHPRALKDGDFCLWSERWLPLPTEQSFERVNRAIRFVYRNKVHARRLYEKKEKVGLFLKQTVQKKEAEYEQLQQAEKSLERADEYEKKANLLMTHAHKSLTPGKKIMNVRDIYKGGDLISIGLKKGLSIAKNAERYYQKAKSSRTSFKNAQQRAPVVQKQQQKAAVLLEELQKIDHLPALDTWIKTHSEALSKFGYGSDEGGQATSPYRKFKVGKYEVWIGKNAKSNDALTRNAHKEDIWLHARGVSGSHTVIRMGNEQVYPHKKIISRAASYAAYYSKARGAEMAPVMYTKRKYVYKPSGGERGAVVLKREEVVMVTPEKPA